MKAILKGYTGSDVPVLTEEKTKEINGNNKVIKYKKDDITTEEMHEVIKQIKVGKVSRNYK